MLKIGHSEIISASGHDTAYAVLSKLWQEEFGGTLPKIAYTDRGKPYFENIPTFFSVTHTRNHAFCVISDRRVGIDAEEIDRVVNPALAEKILSPGEYAQYCASQNRNRALLTFWVLKEAAAKCTGEGLRGYPNETDFLLNDPRVTERNGCLVAIIEGE